LVYGSTTSTSERQIWGWPAFTDPFHAYEEYQQANWDGYGAEPITPWTLAAARSFYHLIPHTFGEPEYSPGADGSIGLEWLLDAGPLRKLFIDIGPGRTWKAYWRLSSGATGIIPRKIFDFATRKELVALFVKLGS
jgi:hypothetical protein